MAARRSGNSRFSALYRAAFYAASCFGGSGSSFEVGGAVLSAELELSPPVRIGTIKCLTLQQGRTEVGV